MRAETFCHSRLFSGDPFTITGPLWLPRNVEAAVRRSRPSFGELLPVAREAILREDRQDVFLETRAVRLGRAQTAPASRQE